MRIRAFAFAAVLLLAACSKVTEENYAKIRDGMTELQVRAILGTPTESSSGNIMGVSGTSSKWAAKDAQITIRFVNGKVALRRFEKPGKKQ